MSDNDGLDLQEGPPLPPRPAPVPTSPAGAAPRTPPDGGLGREALRDAGEMKKMLSPGGLSDFLNFRKFLFPVVVKYVYILLTVLSVLGALGMVFGGLFNEAMGIGMVVMGLIALVLYPVFIRIGCETAVIFFKIHEELKTMNERQAGDKKPAGDEKTGK